ncbi:hypothetical protein RFI_38916, partial [Reticulomyxa filosa]
SEKKGDPNTEAREESSSAEDMYSQKDNGVNTDQNSAESPSSDDPIKTDQVPAKDAREDSIQSDLYKKPTQPTLDTPNDAASVVSLSINPQDQTSTVGPENHRDTQAVLLPSPESFKASLQVVFFLDYLIVLFISFTRYIFQKKKKTDSRWRPQFLNT